MEEIEREIDLEPQYYRPFLETARSIFDDGVYALVHEALRLAVDRLKGMTRHDGTPLVTHSINTAMIVIREVGLGRNSTISTLLHDVASASSASAFCRGCATYRTLTRRWPTTRSTISAS